MVAKKSARYLKYTTPMWDFDLHVVEGATLTDAVVEARRRWPDLDLNTKDMARADGGCLINEDEEPIILLPIGASPGCVAHECLHAMHFILQKAGVPLSTTKDETAAYTLQHIVDAVAPWLTSRRRVHAPVAPAPVKPPRATEPSPESASALQHGAERP